MALGACVVQCTNMARSTMREKLQTKLANGNGVHSPAPASGGQVNKMLVLLLFVMVALNVYQQTSSAGLYLYATSNDDEYYYEADEGR